MGAVIREEIDGFWRGLDPPSVCVFDGTSFGHPPRLHTELQAVAVVPDPAQEGSGARAAPPVPPARRAFDEVGAGSSAPAVCHRRVGSLDLASIAELTVTGAAGNADAQAARLVEQLSTCTAAAGMSVADVRRVFAFIASDTVGDALRRRLRTATDVVLHAVPVASRSGSDGVTVKAGATAARAMPSSG
jgi:hypothetical protein